MPSVQYTPVLQKMLWPPPDDALVVVEEDDARAEEGRGDTPEEDAAAADDAREAEDAAAADDAREAEDAADEARDEAVDVAVARELVRGALAAELPEATEPEDGAPPLPAELPEMDDVGEDTAADEVALDVPPPLLDDELEAVPELDDDEAPPATHLPSAPQLSPAAQSSDELHGDAGREQPAPRAKPTSTQEAMARTVTPL